MTAGLVQAHSHRHIITNGWDATTSLVLMLSYLYKTKGSRFAFDLGVVAFQARFSLGCGGRVENLVRPG